MVRTAGYLLLLLVLAAGPARSAAPPPNFIFILADDLGQRDLGCYGSRFFQTPHLDRLAAQGMKFTQAYAACCVCSPTRASIMTGKYPARLNLTDWLPGRRDMPSQKLLRPVILQHLPLEEVTIAEALKPAGYATASIGKWHLGLKGFEPKDQGFDVSVITEPKFFPPYKAIGLDSQPEGEYLTDRLTSEAIRFIESNQNKPFFLYLPHNAVHIPLEAKTNLVAKYTSRHPAAGDPQTNVIYAAMMESLDENVGRLLQKLDELKLADRTVVVFFSDNGGLSVHEGPNTPSTSNAPWRDGKGYLHEGGIREPLLVRWPGVVKPGSLCTTPVSSIDFFPTLLEIAGVKNDRPIDGLSLVSLLKGGTPPRRDALFWHYPHYANQGGRPSGAIREGDFKLIEFYEDGRVELFNLATDPGETTDLSGSMKARAVQLQARLDLWRRQTQAQMPMPNPDYRGDSAP